MRFVDHGEKTMQIQEHTTETIGARRKYARAMTSTRINLNLPSDAISNSTLKPDSNTPSQPLFECLARTTIAERFPVLTCFVISFALLATALITEIECLKGSGYFWR
jgi:hypothetical protein